MIIQKLCQGKYMSAILKAEKATNNALILSPQIHRLNSIIYIAYIFKHLKTTIRNNPISKTFTKSV